MKYVTYKGENLASNSKAYELMLEAQKATGKEKQLAERRFDLHMKEVNDQFNKYANLSR